LLVASTLEVVTVGEIYLESAAVTTDFLSRPVVASRWDAPSALPMLRIGGLTAHLVGQLTQVPPVLDAPVVNEQVSLAEHFAMSTWTDGIIDSDVNTYIRRAAEEDARLGAEALNAAASDALATLRRRLPGESPDRVIQLPWGPWALTLDDYLVTRLLELAVHCDDLAASLGVPAPALPAGCWEAAIGELSRMAARRHGPSAVIRALSRAERAPRTIAAI
jgi:hypothetical protein